MQPAADRPRFRQDLLAEAIEEHGAKFIDVMDPDSGSVFRFYEVEFSIACGMDGERDVPGLVRWAQDELGLTPSDQEIRTVIATLGDLGYLDLAAAARAAAADRVAPVPAIAEPAPPAVVVAPAPPAPSAMDTTGDVEAEVVITEPAPPDEGPADTVAQHSEVSIDLADHIAVGPEDVQEAVRQSRVMAAVDMPADVAAVTSRPPTPLPADSAPLPVPVVTSEAVSVVPDPFVAPIMPAPPPLPPRPMTPPAGAPVVAKPPVKPPIELTKIPEPPPAEPKQPVRPTVERRVSPVLIILLILAVLGAGAFFAWKYLLNKPSETGGPAVGSAPVTPTPPPPPPPPPPKPVFSAKIELSSGPPKTILAFFPGTIEWVETSGKDAKSNDVILKLVGAKPLEAQVAALKKDVDKRSTDLQAIYKARDAAQTAGDDAAMKKAQTKIDELEKALNAKQDQLTAKADQLEPFLVRLIQDGTLTMTRKVGEKIPENTPIATIVSPPGPSATFKVPEGTKLETGTAVAVRLGEKLVTCTVADWEPQKLRVVCPSDPGVVEGATVTMDLP